jgi:ribosomal protein L4
VFGLEPRADILHRVVTWQLEKRRGTARGPRASVPTLPAPARSSVARRAAVRPSRRSRCSGVHRRW